MVLVEAMLKIFSVFKGRPEAKEVAPARGSVALEAAGTATDEYWAQRRAPQFGNLSGWTREWLQALPETVRPVELSEQHPHVANRLALSWRDAAVTEQVFEDLLLGKRKKRKGFAPTVLAELLLLREFHSRGRVAPSGEFASAEAMNPQADGTTADSAWASLRAPLCATDLVLSVTAQDWLESMPRQLRPAQLCAHYPRVVNLLALRWNDPVSTSQLLDDLLIGKRPGRRGFPGPVAEELMRLRRFHDTYRGIELQETV